jgi:hypothetical protein
MRNNRNNLRGHSKSAGQSLRKHEIYDPNFNYPAKKSIEYLSMEGNMSEMRYS